MAFTREELLAIRGHLQTAFSAYQPTAQMKKTEIGREIAAEFIEKQNEISYLFAIIDGEIEDCDRAAAQKLIQEREERKAKREAKKKAKEATA